MSDEEFARALQADEERSFAAQRRARQEEEQRSHTLLLQQEGTCAVCREVLGPDLVLDLGPPCSHRVCSDCLRQALLHNTAAVFPCPVAGCPGHVAEALMRRVLDSGELDAVQGRAMKAFLAASSASYVTCPSCKETFEAVPSSAPTPTSAGAGGAEVMADGSPLTAAALSHRSHYRYRCGSCGVNFCSGCGVEPYHLGYSCQEWADYTSAVHCRYCECAMPAQAAQSAAGMGVAGAQAVGGVLARWTRSKKKDVEARPSNVCGAQECQDKAALACPLVHACSHQCDGIRGEKPCLPCLTAACPSNTCNVTRDEYCNICWTETLGQAPCVQLQCLHVFHLTCMQTKISKGWPSARITFYFLNCPLCNAAVQHRALSSLLQPLLELKAVVRKKATERLVWEGCQNDAELQKGGKYEGRKEDYAMDLFAYYQCHTCKQPYFGGRRQCEEAAGGGGSDEKKWDPKELVCGGCVASDPTSAAAGCAKHGKEFIEYKCKWCCNIATWYCWGSTHFCSDCHKRQEGGEYLTRKPLSELPKCDGKCALGVKHPPNGTEFALGCGICRPRAAF